MNEVKEMINKTAIKLEKNKDCTITRNAFLFWVRRFNSLMELLPRK